MTRRRAIAWGAAIVGALALVLVAVKLGRFPPDTTPEGAYLRIANSIGVNDPRACFAYLEDRAQHAAYTIRDYRRKASERIEASYPEPERARLLEQYRAHAMAEDGADVWVDMATKQGFIARLRRDMSGIGKVEVTGERATVETARGTRYPFRRRDNGIWGLTLFTADLVAEAERAARDWDVVEKAALDYERGR
ncbi:hypothetical protein WMF27_43610 [Sorangium sp. So ce281]|uniref:hypothetical protein n=1 Tax=unclassified Sorangium TaxID=2621164 RepID=UPI003F5EBA67